ncbi:MAG: autotransporter-associated beta strand repeat-containing protein [Lentimonas sp.]
MNSKGILFIAVAIVAFVTTSQAAGYVNGYTKGANSQLLLANGGVGAVTFVDQAAIGGGDMSADAGNPTWGWEIDGSSRWALTDKVEFTGIAMPIWAKNPSSDNTGNTQNATHRIRIYTCGANNSFDGAGVDGDTLIGSVDVTFGLADAGVDEYYVNFDAPIVWASADSTKFYFHIQAISTGDGAAMRFKTGTVNTADAVLKNRTNGTAFNVGGSSTTQLSVAGVVNRRVWHGDASADGTADWDAMSLNWDAGAGTFADGNLAIFNETFDGDSSDVNLVGSLSPASILVSNTSGGAVPNYTLSGIGNLTGSMGLARSGDGTLVINNTGVNDFTGGVLIEEGTIKIEVADALPTVSTLTLGGATGSATFMLNGFDQTLAALKTAGANTRRIINGSTTATTLTIDSASNSTYSAQLGDSSLPATDDANNFAVVKAGAGTLNISGGNNTFNGGLTVEGGIYQISSDAGLGAVPAAATADSITLDGGTLRTHMAAGTGGSFEINSNRLITLGSGGGTIRATTPSGAWLVTYNGVISGPGSLTKSFAQNLSLGGLNTYAGDTTVTGGILLVNGTAIPDSSQLVIDGGKVAPTGAEVVDSLFFGATQQVDGTWGATGSGATNIDDTRFSGTAGVISVTSGPASYTNWAAGFGGLSDTTRSLDFDMGGLDTGIEYVVGGDPTLATDDVTLAPTSVYTGSALVFTYRRTDLANDDLSTTIFVEYGSDLAGWEPAQHAVDGVDITVNDEFYDDGIDQVIVTLPSSLAVDGKIFARLATTDI